MQPEQMNVMKSYQSMSAGDKTAMSELRKEEALRLGREIPLSDIISAVTPGMKTPDYFNQK